MAAGILKVTPEQLQSTAASFEGHGTEVNNLTQQMTALVTGLSGQVWTGEAATAYVNKFNQLQDDMQRIYKMIKEHSTDLIEMAQQYSSAEQTSVELANSLSGDVIV
ncbi:MAG: WXG100 family type VII secretion target [Eubacteriales bacterium]|nr:WXG100 family type VII secretion target [Eubacteriales bacterium]